MQSRHISYTTDGQCRSSKSVVDFLWPQCSRVIHARGASSRRLWTNSNLLILESSKQNKNTTPFLNLLSSCSHARLPYPFVSLVYPVVRLPSSVGLPSRFVVAQLIFDDMPGSLTNNQRWLNPTIIDDLAAPHQRENWNVSTAGWGINGAWDMGVDVV